MDKSVALPYFAGVVDSDGCIAIVKRSSGYSIQYSECVRVAQVERNAIDLLFNAFGGRIRIVQNGGNRKPLFEWRAQATVAYRAIKEIEPYLTIKRDRAINCMKLRQLLEESERETRGKGMFRERSLKLMLKMELLYLKSRELNGSLTIKENNYDTES